MFIQEGPVFEDFRNLFDSQGIWNSFFSQM